MTTTTAMGKAERAMGASGKCGVDGRGAPWEELDEASMLLRRVSAG
ncbi:hypothetical protein [Rathayibacter tritici]|nr:hypothetical protein [Rathayibacter tritici]